MLLLSFSALAYLPWLVLAHQIPLSDGRASPLTPAFEKVVHENLERWHMPGLAIAIIDGEETYSKGYGIATYPSHPINPSTLFYTASTTKSFTAAAASFLIDSAANSSSKITWQTHLADLLREDFVLPDNYITSHTTIEDALSHRTGMPRHDLSWMHENMTLKHVVQNLRNLPLTAEPRTKWQYCNMMYIVISHFIETWTGEWLGDFLRTRIYEPLNMTDTFFALKDAQRAEKAGGASLATGYLWANYSQKHVPVPWQDTPQISGAGATISNVLDYAKWIRCHMTKSAPLSPAGHDALHAPRIVTGDLFNETTGFRGAGTYALGWEIGNYRGETMHSHSGGLPGFATMMLYFPRLQWGLAMMANGGDGVAIFTLMFRLIDDMLGVPEEERFDWGESWLLRKKLAREGYENAKELLYPNAPRGKDAIPLSLPLEAYTGVYTHPAYPSFTLSLIPTPLSSPHPHPHPTFHCHPTNPQIFPMSLSLEHVSGEYFLVRALLFLDESKYSPQDFDPSENAASKASFTIGEDGKVDALGMVLDGDMGDEKIWFKKSTSRGCAGGHGGKSSGGGGGVEGGDGLSHAFLQRDQHLRPFNLFEL